MHVGPFYIFIQPLVLSFWLSFTGASPVPVLSTRNNPKLRFKAPQEWVKSQSQSLCNNSREKLAGHRSGGVPYISPYLTRFVEKEPERFNLRQFSTYLLWEVIPEWWRGAELQREDVLLLRAMEQPLYMKVEELPPDLVRRKAESPLVIDDL